MQFLNDYGHENAIYDFIKRKRIKMQIKLHSSYGKYLDIRLKTIIIKKRILKSTNCCLKIATNLFYKNSVLRCFFH